MRKAVTAFSSILLLLVAAMPALAQTEVTVKEINAIPQANIDAIKALGTNVTEGDLYGSNCSGLIWEGTLCGEYVQFTGVVLSDPFNSGNASVNGDGNPGRIHVWMRDIAAETEGPEGMGIQVVDGSAGAIGTLTLNLGDVVTVVGTVEPYFSTMQLTPESFQVVGARDLTDDIMQPIVVQTADINMNVGPGGAVQINWDNFTKYRGNFVRFENARLMQRTLGDRPDFSVSSDGGTTSVAKYDISLRFRNDKSDYPSTFNVLQDDFEPPPPGSSVNLQGFLAFSGRSGSDPYSLAVPYGISMNINPMADGDLEVTEAPVNVTNVQRTISYLGNAPTTLNADVIVDPTRQLSSLKLLWTVSSDPLNEQSANPSGFVGETYSFTLPPVPDGDFVNYWFYATDNGGGVFEQDEPYSLRALYNGVTQVSHIQQTADGKEGDSPLDGYSVEMDLVVTVQGDLQAGCAPVQDGTAPWSGVFACGSSGVQPSGGDQIRITRAEVDESYGLTTLDIEEFEILGPGTAIEPVVLTTAQLSDPDIAESYEGMVVKVENAIVISTNADAPNGPYGEFVISDDGTEGIGLRVDDFAVNLYYGEDDDPATVVSQWERLAFVEGMVYFSFGNFKLAPESLDKIGPAVNVATESSEVPDGFALEQNYPNPFNPSTSIRFDVPVSGVVTLDVYDGLGRFVQTLVNGERIAGSHSVTFDATGMASGLYLYRLTAGGQTASRTMLLLK